jgi:FdhD protein
MSLPETQLEHQPSEPEVPADASFEDTNPSVRPAEILRVRRGEVAMVQDAVAVEEPLEIQLVYGAADDRKIKSISITMRTPGNDDELAAGFLMTEGVVRDATHLASIGTPSAVKTAPPNRTDGRQVALPTGLRSQVIRIELSP